MDFDRMRYLINRLPMARYRVDIAMAEATNVSPSFSGMPGVSGNTGKLENSVIRLQETKAAYSAIRDELAVMKSSLRSMLDRMDNPLQKNVIRMRYLEGKRVQDIGWYLNYSERHIRRVLEKAEKNIEKMSAMSEESVIK